MATPGRKTGFDCEFVKKPPEVLQSECPVCLQVLCEPYQSPCCGNSFCKECIQTIKNETNRCPTCNEENFVTFHNKGLQRSLYRFQVYCSHKLEGCDWKGELGQLDNHFNLSPKPDKCLEGCKYSEIECIYCSELIKRCGITIHQDDHCPKRPFSCEYCYSYETHYEDVIHNHWPVCGYHPVHCPNKCGKLLLRQALKNHIAEECPKAVVDCDFRHVGCDVRLSRKDMPTHLKENFLSHVSLQAASHRKLLASHSELKSQANKLEIENKMLKNELATYNELRASLLASHSQLQVKARKLEQENRILKQGSIARLGYIEFTIKNFKRHKKDSDTWFSPPFYTHPGGYKFCLRVDANGYIYGDGKRTYITVGVCLMRGEFGDQLRFPFRGRITVQLVDQEGGKKHYTKSIDFTDQTPDVNAGRVMQGERQAKARGHPQFISHDRLEPKYLKNDCLRFKITRTIGCQ